MEWMSYGACAGSSIDFFSTLPKKNREAKKICDSCPVKSECYNYALQNEPFGFWGGATQEELESIRFQMGIPSPQITLGIKAEVKKSGFDSDDPRHGTDTGYQMHVKRKIPTCEPCREAHRIKIAVYRSSVNKKGKLSA